jgi:hypothetical protein
MYNNYAYHDEVFEWGPLSIDVTRNPRAFLPLGIVLLVMSSRDFLKEHREAKA